MISEAEKILYDLEKLLEQSSEVEKIFRSYLQGIAHSLKVDRVSLMLLDEARKELFIHEAQGLFPELKTKVRVKLGEGISGRVAEKGESLFVQDATKSDHVRKDRGRKGIRSGGFICIAIKARGRVYGVLNVSEKKNHKPFSLEDLKQLELFGIQLAMLIENERLRQSIQSLEQRPVEEIAEVSHDFRIPLTCVQEVLNLMEKEDLGPITASQKRFIDLAKRNVKRMIGTFDHLIHIATRINEEPTEIEEVNLADLVGEVGESFEPKARKKSVRIEVEILGQIHPIRTESIKIHEVMNNFVDNAVKHTRLGSAVKLRLIDKKSGHVRFEVEDKGPGMKAAEKKIIFDKAASIQRAKQRGLADSHGLGLAISRDMIGSLGGKIGFSTRAGKGSTFYFELPRSAKTANK